MGVLALLLAATMLGPGRPGGRGAVVAGGAPGGAAGSGSAAVTTTVAYTDTGQEQHFVVAAGVTHLRVVAVGGRGGSDDNAGAVGRGAVVTATLVVTSGLTLYVEVGGDGALGNTNASGGFNGGGAGGEGQNYAQGGGGGGASDVRTCARAAVTCATLGSRLLVAGGGGGSGAASDYGGPGGGGGGGGYYGGGGGGGGGGGSSSDGDGGGGGGSSFVARGATRVSMSLAPRGTPPSITISDVRDRTSLVACPRLHVMATGTQGRARSVGARVTRQGDDRVEPPARPAGAWSAWGHPGIRTGRSPRRATPGRLC